MATGGPIDEENSLDSREEARMKTSGLCVKNGFAGELRYAEEYQTSPESSESLRPRGTFTDEEEDEISVGIPSPAPERLDGYHSDEDSCSRRPESPLISRTSFPEERSSGDEVDQSDDRTSSLSSASTTIHCRRPSHTCSSEDDGEHRDDEYFKPLKKLKMMQIDKVSYSINRSKTPKRIHRPQAHSPKESIPRRASSEESSGSNGVKSFSILDILNHRPSKGVRLEEPRDTVVPTRIVRPWDYGGLEDPGVSCIPPPAHRGLIPPPPPLLLERYHRVHQHLRPKSADLYDTSASTCSSSGRSSTGGSDCCTSPDLPPRRAQPPPRPKGKQPSASPLDALFQMTSKTFEELNGEAGPEGQANHLNLFNSRQQPKKKRKSRTAFTNHQIFELEKRFLYQKYLSPADRDEIAAQLGLTNAQVITWFQNRRAKLKRDMEELKKDVESTKVLSAHKSFLENVQNLGILKKKSVAGHDVEDKPLNVVMEK